MDPVRSTKLKLESEETAVMGRTGNHMMEELLDTLREFEALRDTNADGLCDRLKTPCLNAQPPAFAPDLPHDGQMRSALR